MKGLTIGRLFELMNEHKLDPSTEISFCMGNRLVKPDQIEASVCGSHGPYSGRRPEILVKISGEWVEARTQERMKQMFAAQVDAMFEPKEVASGN